VTNEAENRPRARTDLWLALGTLAVLVPFGGKAFHIDDPLFLQVAEQIGRAPLDFFGFELNWYGVVQPMFDVTRNPPLTGYWLAAFGTTLGFSEWVLHAAMWFPAIALALGIRRLAAAFCDAPLLATVIALATPAVLVPATSIMSDIPMLALWCWSVVWFDRGLKQESGAMRALVCAGLLAGAAALTKYFGLALVPLLLLYGLVHQRRLGPWALCLLIPLALTAAFDGWTSALYGRHVLLDAAGYASDFVGKPAGSLPRALGVGLSFLGGALLPTLFFAPFVWKRRTLVVGSSLVIATGLGLLALDPPEGAPDIALQLAVFAGAGVHVLGLAARDLVQRRDATSVLLGAWVAGVLCFAAFTNWTANVRSILPAAPAVAILLVRALPRPLDLRAFAPLLVAGLALSLAVTWADDRLAESARSAASHFSAGRTSSTPARFAGAWGFQHYMQRAGFERVRIGETLLEPGDLLIVPRNNTNAFELAPQLASAVDRPGFAAARGIAVMARERGAGFHTAQWGPLPFSFGPAPEESYTVYRMRRQFRLHLR